MVYIRLALLLIILFLREDAVAQSDFFKPASSYNELRLKGAIITEVAATTVIFIGLNYLWYKKFPRSRFHFFNDNAEWLTMDKAGHVFSAYNIAAIQKDVLQWAGVKPTEASWIGTTTALGLLSLIE